MTVIIKKNIDKKEFEEILTAFKENKKSKGVDTSKHCGSIKLTKDSLIIQKELRNEWE
ncbi:hypothetical protein [Flavobacterium succinicans]|uniref:Uncharacterized protein n=1 Tax=Flavobacterium succinicans TaxID=29536 RepID=A0A199XN50_9FLAO|nr:hypothetical protein [Flavobacterium succinicans]OAZ02847.1 hypothetical protein FLB_28250 [Flavobacterium succinicans]